MDQIKKGDVVQMKSGGPLMTVTNIGGNGDSAYCEWFDATNPKAKSFDLCALKLASESKT